MNRKISDKNETVGYFSFSSAVKGLYRAITRDNLPPCPLSILHPSLSPFHTPSSIASLVSLLLLSTALWKCTNGECTSPGQHNLKTETRRVLCIAGAGVISPGGACTLKWTGWHHLLVSHVYPSSAAVHYEEIERWMGRFRLHWSTPSESIRSEMSPSPEMTNCTKRCLVQPTKSPILPVLRRPLDC